MKILFFFLAIVFSFGLFANSAAALSITSFQADPISACAIRLSWTTDVQPAAISFNQGGAQWYQLENNSNSFVYSDSDNRFGLAPGEQKNFRIRVTDGGNWITSNAVSSRSYSLPVAPALPDNLSNNWVLNGDGHRLDISWQANAEQGQDRRPGQPRANDDNFADFTGFEIKRDDLGAYSLLKLSDFNGTYGLIDTLFNANHSFRVRTYQTDKYCSGEDGTINYFDENNSKNISIPKQPMSFGEIERNINANPIAIKFGWTQLAGADLAAVSSFRLEQFIENGDNWDSVSVQTLDNNNASESGFINFSVPEASYKMELKACKTASGVTGCSAPASFLVSPILPGPENFGWGLQSLARNNEAKIFLSWKDGNILGNRLRTEIWRRVFGGDWPNNPVRSFENEFPQSFVDYVQVNDTYQYRTDFIYQNGNSEIATSSPVLTVNLNNLSPLVGWAWSSNLGWIKLNNGNVDNLNGRYGVYVNDNNRLMGYAWSSNNGWVSFNMTDSNNCPGGSCNGAQRNDNQIIGWAKFLVADPTKGAWTGWLHLSSSVDGDGPDQPAGGEEERPVQGGLGLSNFFSNIIESFSNLLRN
ncbi:MAG: hypothetical protein Q8L36_00410 [bacterium]|nr:hypothetical protein [bacterium]